MKSDAALSRDARALFEVAERAGAADRVGAELDALTGALATDPEVARVLSGAAIPPAQMVNVVRAVGERLGLSRIVQQLLELLAERNQLGHLSGLASAYRARLLDRRNVVEAEVTTAVALPTERVNALAARLGEVTGKNVRLQAHVDSTIIGGVVTRIGSTVYDGSVTGQLSRMRQKLVENV
jgi:F-type H+-transporting ATPase subunit delta